MLRNNRFLAKQVEATGQAVARMMLDARKDPPPQAHPPVGRSPSWLVELQADLA
jgi:hypothetical protein